MTLTSVGEEREMRKCRIWYLNMWLEKGFCMFSFFFSVSLSLCVWTAECPLALSEVLFIVCNQLLDSNPLTRVQSLNASSHADTHTHTHLSSNYHFIIFYTTYKYRFCGDQIVLTWTCPHDLAYRVYRVWSSSVSSGFRLLTLLIWDVLKQISWERLTHTL